MDAPDQSALIEIADRVARRRMNRVALPALHQAFRRLRKGDSGLLLLHDLPKVEGGKRELIRTALLARAFGPKVLGDGRPGQYITRIRDRGTKAGQPTGDGTNRPFIGHTDNSYARNPAAFLGMVSIHNREEDGGRSRFAAVRDVIPQLTAAQIEELTKPQFRVPAPADYSDPTANEPFPILSRNGQGEYTLRFRRDGLTAMTAEGIAAAIALADGIDRASCRLSLAPDCAVILSNFTIVHAREGFSSAGCQEKPRQLHRWYAASK